MDSMKIVINGRFLLQNVTGVQRVEREILLALDDLSNRGIIDAPELYVPKNGDLIHLPKLKAIKVTRVGEFGGHIWEQFVLPRFCKNKILWCLGNTAPIISLYSRKTKVLTMVHDLSYRYFPTAYSWKFKLLYSILIPKAIQLSDNLVTVSESERKAMMREYPKIIKENRFHAAQNGGIPDNLAEKNKNVKFVNRDERNYGIYVGSLSKRKNADSVLRAAVSFLQKYPKMTFMVIGATSGVFESFDVDIPKDISARLIFRGQINDPDVIYSAFKNARFLLFPSFYEASPLPPIEAMTFGCPVIASNIPSLKERCKDAALYCDPHEIHNIEEKIESIMESEELHDKLVRNGAVVSSGYSWLGQTKKLLALSGYSV